MTTTTYALIPGAGGDSDWYWQLVVAELGRRGHEALAVELPTADDSAVFGGNYDESITTGHTWAFGDMNYDGACTPDDAAIFGGAYDESLASPPDAAVFNARVAEVEVAAGAYGVLLTDLLGEGARL